MKIASKTFRWMMASLMLLIGASLAHAESKPVVVVSLPSYDKLTADVDFIGQLIGQPGLSQQLDGMVKVFTQGQGLKGLDKAKPWGVALLVNDGAEMTPVAFLPVTSAKELVDALAGVLGPSEDAGGVLKVSPPNSPPVYVREKNGWAYVTQTDDAPLPDDPMKLLAGLNTQYDVAVRAYVQNVPEAMRKSAIEKLKGFMQMAAAMQPNQNEMSRNNMESQLQSLEQTISFTDQITFGWNIDIPKKTTYFDFSLTAVAGTQLDKQLQQLNDTHSDLAGFLMADSAIKFNSAGKYSPEQIAQAVASLEQFRQKSEDSVDHDNDLSEESRTQVKEALGQLFEQIQQTIQSGKSDMGATVKLSTGKFQAAAGAYVADGPALEAIFKKLVAMAQEDPSLNKSATAKLDLETYKTVHFHQVQIKLPEEADEHARKIFGDKLEVYFGTGPQTAYVAVGAGSLELLKKAIDDSAAQPAKAVLPMQLTVALGPIIRFAASVDEHDSAKLTVLADELDKVKDKDHILVTAKPISGGAMYRIQAEEGVLEAVGEMSKMRMQGAHPPGGPKGKHSARPGAKSIDKSSEKSGD